jgi:hypothetical protein
MRQERISVKTEQWREFAPLFSFVYLVISINCGLDLGTRRISPRASISSLTVV